MYNNQNDLSANYYNSDNNEGDGLREKISIALENYVENLNFLERFFKPGSFIFKLILLLGFLILLGFMIYFVAKSIIEYKNYEFVTISLVKTETTVEFPVVTICNLNPFTTFNSALLYNQLKINQGDYYANYIFRHTAASLPDEEKKTLGPNIDNMLIEGYFYDEDIETINTDDFEWIYLFDYGNCFQWNSKYRNPKTVRNPILGYLQMFYFIEPNSVLPIGESWQLNTRDDNGLSMFIDNRNYSLLSVFSRGFNLKPGTFTKISLRKVVNQKLGDPYNECQNEFPNEPIYMEKFSGKAYTEKNCIAICVQQVIMQKCNCASMFLEKIDTNAEPCLSQEQIDCANVFIVNFLFKAEIQECSKKCLPECTSLKYEWVTSYSTYPNNKKIDYLQTNNPLIMRKLAENNIDPLTQPEKANHFLRENTAGVGIYFESFLYTYTEEQPKQKKFQTVYEIGGK